MPYSPTSWSDGVTAATAARLNNLETQYVEATNSFEQDLLSAFVLSGLAPSKDGTLANQLDVTSGVAFPSQTDGTLRRRAINSSTQTTSTPNTTYYLFLNSDGTWTWGTSSSGPAHSLQICQVTTDASGNISAVTDKRVLSPSMLSGMAGPLLIPTSRNGAVTCVPIYTGATTPVGDGVVTPATGAVWLKS